VLIPENLNLELGRMEMWGFLVCALVATLSVVDADLLWADVCTQADVKGAKWCDMTASAQVWHTSLFASHLQCCN
jgi:hypothetical protein